MKFGSIKCSIGEIADRHSILRLKFENCDRDPSTRDRIGLEIKELDPYIEASWKHLYDDLARINAELWKLEDHVRSKKDDDDLNFARVARRIQRGNDERHAAKRRIDEFVGSDYAEVKIYSIDR